MNRLGLAFEDEDMKLLEKLQRQLSKIFGKASYVFVVRYALRELEKSLRAHHNL